MHVLYVTYVQFAHISQTQNMLKLEEYRAVFFLLL